MRQQVEEKLSDGHFSLRHPRQCSSPTLHVQCCSRRAKSSPPVHAALRTEQLSACVSHPRQKWGLLPTRLRNDPSHRRRLLTGSTANPDLQTGSCCRIRSGTLQSQKLGHATRWKTRRAEPPPSCAAARRLAYAALPPGAQSQPWVTAKRQWGGLIQIVTASLCSAACGGAAASLCGADVDQGKADAEVSASAGEGKKWAKRWHGNTADS